MKEILIRKTDGTAVITLNRPDRLNAIDPKLALKITAAMKGLARDRHVRCITITGAGRGFCSGLDLSAFSGRTDGNAAYEYVIKYYRPMILAIHDIEKPVICAVNGTVAGAGIGIMLACDYRIMSAKAVLIPAFGDIGLVPDAGVSWLLTRCLGYGRAFEILLSGRKLLADECLKLGLAHRLERPEELEAGAGDIAELLAKRPFGAAGLTKKTLQYAGESSLEEAIEFEARQQQRAVLSDDFQMIVSKLINPGKPDRPRSSAEDRKNEE